MTAYNTKKHILKQKLNIFLALKCMNAAKNRHEVPS